MLFYQTKVLGEIFVSGFVFQILPGLIALFVPEHLAPAIRQNITDRQGQTERIAYSISWISLKKQYNNFFLKNCNNGCSAAGKLETSLLDNYYLIFYRKQFNYKTVMMNVG